MSTTTAPTTATTAVTPATTATTATTATVPTLVATVEKDAEAAVAPALTWLQKHERIILVFLVLLAASWLGNHWLNNTAARDKQAATVAAQQLAGQVAKDAQLASQVTQLNTQYQTVIAQLTAQSAQLVAAQQNRTVVLEQQQATDKTMPLPDLGNRWAALIGVAPTELSASGTGITASSTASISTVEQLEQVPVLTQNLKDEATVADNRQQEVDKGTALVTGLNTQVTGLNLPISDDKKACVAEVASVKATARKGKLKSFLYGAGAGAGVVVWLFAHI